MKIPPFRDKVAIITGSSAGIGKAIAKEFGKQGIKVVLNGRDRKKLNDATVELRDMGYEVLPIAADIRHAEQCKKLIDCAIRQYGRIDIVINNAAVSSRGAVEDSALSNFQVLIDTNYIGSLHMSKFAIPHLRKTKGHIIFINSVAGLRGMPYNAAYSASKMAQGALAESLRIELRDDNIHIGTVYVGFTQNDPSKTILDVDGSWVVLPKRNNIKLATKQSVALAVFKVVRNRRSVMSLTILGKFTYFMSRRLPGITALLIRWTRHKIKTKFTYISTPQKIVREEIIKVVEAVE